MTDDTTPRPGTSDAPDDPSTVHLDARSLRALAHPLRVRLLSLLREQGASTATGLAALVGESSGVTSYHLRQLASYGLVVEDEAPHASRRERWWRAAHRTTSLEPLPERDPETDLLVDEYLRAVAHRYADRLLRHADALHDVREALGRDWNDAGDMSDWWLELTAEEAAALRDELHEVLDRHRRVDVDAERLPGHERVVVQVQVMPTTTTTTSPTGRETTS